MIVACSPRKTSANSNASTRANPRRLATNTWPSVGRQLETEEAKASTLSHAAGHAEQQMPAADLSHQGRLRDLRHPAAAAQPTCCNRSNIT